MAQALVPTAVALLNSAVCLMLLVVVTPAGRCYCCGCMRPFRTRWLGVVLALIMFLACLCAMAMFPHELVQVAFISGGPGMLILLLVLLLRALIQKSIRRPAAVMILGYLIPAAGFVAAAVLVLDYGCAAEFLERAASDRCPQFFAQFSPTSLFMCFMFVGNFLILHGGMAFGARHAHSPNAPPTPTTPARRTTKKRRSSSKTPRMTTKPIDEASKLIN